jgi:DNA-directed RNA polymerase subunit K/omega
MNQWRPPIKTVPYLTSYELVKVIGIRATQLQYGAASAIRYQEYGLDPEDVLGRARQELALRKIHVLLRRPLSCTHACTEEEFVTLNALSFEIVPGIEDEFIEALPSPSSDDEQPTTLPTYNIGDCIMEDDSSSLYTCTLKKTVWIYPPERGPERCVRFVTTVIRNMASTVVCVPDPLNQAVESHALVVQALSYTQINEVNKLDVDGALIVPFEVVAMLYFVRPFSGQPTLATCTIRHVFMQQDTDLLALPTALRNVASRSDAMAMASLDIHDLCTAIVHVIVTFPLDKYKSKLDIATNEMFIQKTGAVHAARVLKNSKIRIRIDSVFTYKDVERAWDDALMLACVGSFIERM